MDFKDNPLDATDVRVLASLIEKEHVTPDNYPLSLNSLLAACNQSSNRDPVLALDEAAVERSLDELARRTLVRSVYRSDSRVKRYRHLMSDTLKLHPAEIAVMCVLMLRGAQTVGELRTRSTRLYEFNDLAYVEITLQALMTLEPPLVVQLPRQPGQKEARYAHLLAGEPPAHAVEPVPAHPSGPSRVEVLETEVGALRAELAELRAQFDAFRREFQ